MKLYKLLIFFLIMNASAALFAQSQNGYVKTLGRQNRKGMPLGGVLVRVKGNHNPVVSNSDGTFIMTNAGAGNSRAYSLQEVKKAGYELNEPDIIGRPLAFSKKARLTIVMVNSAELQAEKQRIGNKAYCTAAKNYKIQLAALEREKTENALAESDYRKRLATLQDAFEKYQLMIDGLAEHYAHVDYDDLDEKEREINTCIENGELERADSLIKSSFDPASVLQRNRESLSKLDQQVSEANKIIAEANADMEAVLKQQEKDANYLYQLYTIALARFDNDKARQYIETRAELDTVNVDWQLDAGSFLDEYLAKYDKALNYYNRALRNALNMFGEQHPDVALSYSNMGSAYSSLGNYNMALEYYNKALNVQMSVYGEQHAEVATSYNNIGYIYYSLGDRVKAMQYINKALLIRSSIYGEQHPDFAASYNNLGGIFSSQRKYTQALACYQKALDIWILIYGKQHPTVATAYNNIGSIYFKLKDYLKAFDYFNKSLDVQLAVYGEHHPDVALSYNNIGVVFDFQEDYIKALEYYNKALDIQLTILGEQHPDVARSYSNIGVVYYYLGDYSQAIDNDIKALNIYRLAYDEQHPDVALSYSIIGVVYRTLGQMEKALECFMKSLNIYAGLYGRYSQEFAGSLKDVYSTYCKLLQQSSDERDEFEMFMSEYVFGVDVAEGETPVSAQGLFGQYYLLEFDDWNIYSLEDLYEKKALLQGTPKDIVVMKNGVISQHYFEDKIGGQINLKYVGQEEKQRIVDAYNKWNKN